MGRWEQKANRMLGASDTEKLVEYRAELKGFEDAVRLIERLTTESRQETIEE